MNMVIQAKSAIKDNLVIIKNLDQVKYLIETHLLSNNLWNMILMEI